MKINSFVSRFKVMMGLLLVFQLAFSQDSFTSVKFMYKNFRLSPDLKTISYDVYAQDIDATNVIATPGFTMRLAVPQVDLGTNEKTVTVTNGTKELGVQAPTMTVSGNNWLMKFTNLTTPLTNAGALVLSDVSPGTCLGTFNISNADGSVFVSPLVFNATFSGTAINTKSSIGIFLPGTTELAPNASNAQPVTNIDGLGTYSLVPATGLHNTLITSISILPNPTTDGFLVDVHDNTTTVNVFDLNGRKLITQQVSGKSYINVSFFPAGVYMVEIDGIKTKLIKK